MAELGPKRLCLASFDWKALEEDLLLKCLSFLFPPLTMRKDKFKLQDDRDGSFPLHVSRIDLSIQSMIAIHQVNRLCHKIFPTAAKVLAHYWPKWTRSRTGCLETVTTMRNSARMLDFVMKQAGFTPGFNSRDREPSVQSSVGSFRLTFSSAPCPSAP